VRPVAPPFEIFLDFGSSEVPTGLFSFFLLPTPVSRSVVFRVYSPFRVLTKGPRPRRRQTVLSPTFGRKAAPGDLLFTVSSLLTPREIPAVAFFP